MTQLNQDDLFAVAGRTAVVTGASSGIGERVCEMLASRGVRVVCCARRADRLQALVERIGKAGGKAMAHPVDIADSKAVPAVFDHAEAEFGLVTILVNNAGIVKTAAIHEMTDELWNQHIAVNLTAAFTFTREAARRMVAAKTPGSIINVGSTGAILGAPGSAAYAAAKGGMASLTRVTAVDLAPHGIRCNTIVPGNTVTEIFNRNVLQTEVGKMITSRIPLGRAAEVTDFDGAVLLLASEASSFITGTEIVVDGGKTISQPGRHGTKRD